MNLLIQRGLPFVRAQINYSGQRLLLDRVLVDTGSMSCLFNADHMWAIGAQLERTDQMRRVVGIGGDELVFTKTVEQLRVGELTAHGFNIQVGAMDYGFEIDAIIGLDFLRATGALLDFNSDEIRRRSLNGVN